MTQSLQIRRVIVVGSGAAGVAAALAASLEGARVTLLERAPQLGVEVVRLCAGRALLEVVGDRILLTVVVSLATIVFVGLFAWLAWILVASIVLLVAREA